MRRPTNANDRTSRSGFRVAAVVTGAASLLLCLPISISAFVAPRQLFGQQQQCHPLHPGFLSSFSDSSTATSRPTWASDNNILFLSRRLASTSAYTGEEAGNNTTTMLSAVLSQELSAASTPLAQRQRQLLLELPRSQRQKVFSLTVVEFVKAGDAEGALLLYEQAAEVGCTISESVFNAVLSVCDGDKISRGARVLSDMVEAGINPRESHYAFLLRDATARGAFKEAFSQVREIVAGGVRPRLRTYSPLLKGLCNKPDMALAADVWSHMTAHGVQPSPEEHIDMIKGWAVVGELRQRVADGSVEAYLEQLSRMAFELDPCGDDTAAPSCDELSGAGGGRGEGEEFRLSGGSGSTSGSGGHYVQILLAAFNADSNFSSNDGKVQTYSTPIRIASVSSAFSESGGVCDCCGAAMKVVGLDAAAKARVRSALIKLASEAAYSVPPQPPQPPPPPPVPPRRRQSSRLDRAYVEEDQEGMERGELGGATGDLEQFAAWLEERRRQGVRYTTVVDGCNVAYYGQNKVGGKFEISQVDRMARQLEQEGEKVLVILPERYLRPCVPNSARSKRGKNPPSALTEDDLEAIDGWRQRQMLYSCANGADDDLFWMYFTVSSDSALIEGDTGTIRGEEDDAASEIGWGYNTIDGIGDEGYETDSRGVGESGRHGGRGGRVWRGADRFGNGVAARLTVVTNDEMRNHRMALLEPVPFKRWRNSQVRRFHFPASVATEDSHSWGTSVRSGAREANEEEEKESSERERHRPPAQGSPPAPIVSPCPPFTRDMQVLKHAWHIPIREEEGEAGTRWLCLNLAALADEKDGLPEELQPSAIRPRRKYRR